MQVLALTGLLTVSGLLTAALVQSYRTNVSLGLLDRHVGADVAAASVVRRILAVIDDPSDDLERRIGVGGPPYALEAFEEDVSATIEGEAGKIDVMHADLAIFNPLTPTEPKGFIGERETPKYSGKTPVQRPAPWLWLAWYLVPRRASYWRIVQGRRPNWQPTWPLRPFVLGAAPSEWPRSVVGYREQASLWLSGQFPFRTKLEM